MDVQFKDEIIIPRSRKTQKICLRNFVTHSESSYMKYEFSYNYEPVFKCIYQLTFMDPDI